MLDEVENVDAGKQFPIVRRGEGDLDFEQGGFHLQINLTDAEVLQEAQKEPEKHADLLIRVSGYSAYFTGLDATLQNALIERAKE